MEAGHDFINMISVANIVTYSRYYSLPQPNMGKEPTPPEIPLQTNNTEVVPHVPKGVLKYSGHNPNA